MAWNDNPKAMLERVEQQRKLLERANLGFMEAGIKRICELKARASMLKDQIETKNRREKYGR